MLDAGQWSKANEKNVLKTRDTLVRSYLFDGYNVIVDDTNLSPNHEKDMAEIAQNHSVDFVVQDFTDVPLKECLKRDSERANGVGEKVIKSMYNSFIKKKGHVAQYTPPPYDPELPEAIIVDIDGTLAHMTGRSPYDYSLVGTDAVDANIREIVCKYYFDRNIQEEVLPTTVFIVSGRESGCKDVTEAWLAQNHIPYDFLFMREAGDHRDDRIVKKEIYDRNLAGKYNVRFVLDDRDRVVNMWREIGLKCLQVAPGDF
jgi:hypothetical protein